jgi:nucleoside-diphosphate-sugar epimerase
MKIFITGASGFIGGAVAATLAKAGHAVRGLIRDPSRADELRAFGIEPVVGTLDDSALLQEESRAADAVINAADSDHGGAVDAMLEALRGSGKRFIHTSGSSLVADNALGEPSEARFDETTPITPVPEKAARIAINDRILAAAPGVHGVVLCHSLIYGNALGPRAQSVQIPPLVAQAQASGIARHVGRGLNRWSNVHVADVAALYVLALSEAPAGSFYFVENGEASFSDLVGAIADRLGLGAAQPWPAADAIACWGKDLGAYALGSNSRVNADKARKELGWTPQHASVLDWIECEMRL